MIDEMRMAFVNNDILIITIIALIFGLLFSKGNRKAFFVPAIIISVIILNPLFYSKWNEYVGRSYWRALWILPIIPACATLPAVIVEKAKTRLLKLLAFIALTICITCFGSLVYKNDGSTFSKKHNMEKLPDEIVEIAEFLLEIDEDPYTVADDSVSQYLRQYSGKIKSMYGRDVVYGGTFSGLAREVYANLQGDLAIVAQKMLNNDYEYLITDNTDSDRKESLKRAGFELIKQINHYGIYSIKGIKTEIRTYNSLHQVTSITTVDENGNPYDPGCGYAMIQYDYYTNGQHKLKTETMKNENGQPVNYNGLYSSIEYIYEKTFDENVSIVNFYDKNGTRLQLGSGYFHEYLTSLLNTNYCIIFSIRDEGTYSLTRTLSEDLHKLGIKAELFGEYGTSFYAIVFPDKVYEEIGKKLLEGSLVVDGHRYNISSAAMAYGNYSSIIIDGTEYSINHRGINIVVYDLMKENVVDSVCFDTFIKTMNVVR